MDQSIKNIRPERENCRDNGDKMVLCPTVLTGMSHEVRTHMNAIVAFSYLMNRDCCNGKEREEFTTQILSSCEQLIGLVDNFIDSAILESGNTKTDLKLCRLNSFFDELLPEFREILQRDTKEVELINGSYFPENIEVLIDSNRVFRVIRNLFLNSLNNTKAGYIKVGYHFRDDTLTFYVLDSGQGFQKCREFINTNDVNDSLSRFNDTYTAINISLAKKLIHLMDGSIWIECNGLTGTGIYFSVPAEAAASSGLNDNEHANTMIAI